MRFSLLIAGILGCASLGQAQTAQIWDFSKSDPKNEGFAAPYAAPGGVAASVTVESKPGALQFTNRAGGSFGVKLQVPPFDATRFPTLDFAYTRSNDAKINFFFKVNGKYYGAIFSGPPRVRPGSFLLGTLPNIGGKGRVVLPLRDWLRRYQPKAETLQVEEILVGNWDNEGYLLAGIGGNGPGATWNLSKFAILPAQDAPPQLGTAFFDGNRLIWPLESGVLDTTKAVLSIDEAKWGFDSPFLHLETTINAQNTPSHRVVFEAGDAKMTLRDAQNLQIALGEAKQTLEWRLGAHSAPVPLPRLDWDGAAPLSLDFETDFDALEPRNATLRLDSQASASGQNSLQLHNPRTASPFDFSFKNGAFDAAQFPILTFAYRHDTRLRVDWRLRWEGKNYFVRFSDRDGTQTKLGEVPDVPDDKWHHAIVPLLDWMKRARPDATNFQLESLGLSDDGWMGNPRGLLYRLDDISAAPALSATLKATVSARDISGVRAVSYGIDQNPQGEVDTAPESGPQLDISLAGRAAGLYFLHLRAQNGAGSWSSAAHFPFVVK